MPNPVTCATAMREIAAYSEQDIAHVRDSMAPLTGKIGLLMAAINTRLTGGKGEEFLFDDDPELAREFGQQLTEFVMRSSAGNFTDEYCQYAAGFATRLSKRPPLAAMVAVNTIISQWLTQALTDVYKDDSQKLAATLTAWQRMLGVNMALLVLPWDSVEK